MPHVYRSGLGVVAEGEIRLCTAYEDGPSPRRTVANGGRCCPHLKLPKLSELQVSELGFPENRDCRFWFTA